MSLENLFKLIRKEDVAIWIGAGFSMYAGFPSGQQLHNKFLDELSEEERMQVGGTSSLRQAASALVTFQSRNALNKILRKEFDRRPNATHLHEMLSRIPHFQEIITTNYDSLIEDSYTNRAVVIRDGKDVPNIETGLPSIYKPHGDLTNLERVIITEEDYAKFMSIDFKDVFWNSILHVLATKTILFLGYGFEDENVWSWINLIDRSTGTNHKQRFLVAPSWPDLKKRKLMERKISYIDMSADEFLNRLDETMKLKLTADLEEKIVSLDTFNQYMEFHGLNSLIKNENGTPKITGLYRLDRPSKQTLSFEVNNKKLAKQINKISKGFGDSVTIPLKELTSLDFFVEGFKMNLGLDNISELVVATLPNKRSCIIEFPEEDISIDRFDFEVFRITTKQIKFKACVEDFDFEVIIAFLKGDGFKMDFKVINPKVLPSTNKGIKLFNALVNYYSGKRAIAFIDGVTYNITAHNIEEDPTYFKNILEFFKNLRILERIFEISFEGGQINFSPSVLAHTQGLVELVDVKSQEVSLNGPFVIYKRLAEAIRNIPKGKSVVIGMGKNQTENFLGQQINFGEIGIQVFNPILTPNPNSTDTFLMESDDKRYWTLYDKLTPFRNLKRL